MWPRIETLAPPPPPPLVEALVETVAEGVETLVETGKEAVDDLGREGERAADQVTTTARDSARTVEETARRGIDAIHAEGRRVATAIAGEVRRGQEKLERDMRRFGEAIVGEIERSLGMSGAVPAPRLPDPPPRYSERRLTENERALAESVFADQLPLDAIAITNALGAFNREYTVPNLAKKGEYLVHMGIVGFADSSRGPGTRSTFIHELTHVWQGEHWSNRPHYVVDSVFNQILLGPFAYSVPPIEDDTSWDSLNAEQQATVVEGWFAEGMSETDPRFRFIRDNIRTGNG